MKTKRRPLPYNWIFLVFFSNLKSNFASFELFVGGLSEKNVE